MISIPYAVASADGLLEEDRETVRCLLNSWQTHYRGNLLRSDYYEARNMLKDLGIAVPDSLRDLEVACGWGYKCVEVMRDHIAFDGFTCPDDEDFDGLLPPWPSATRWPRASARPSTPHSSTASPCSW